MSLPTLQTHTPMYARLPQSNTSSFIFLPFPKSMYHAKISLFGPVRSSNRTVPELTDAPKTVYYDNWLDRMAINHVSHNLQAVAGIEIKEEGYEGLLEACKAVRVKFNPVQQRLLVLEALQRANPTPVTSLFKALLPQTRSVRELFAKFTALFFVWLIGPCEVRESEFNGRREKNVAHIKKCRFLESSNCVGMCTNLCKFPTQTFIKETLGMPVTLVPNFEDMSCEMIFGKEPLASDEDPATKHSCYKLCKISKRHSTQSCPI